MAITLTANDVVRRAFETIGVVAAGEPVDPQDSQTARELLAEMVDSWNIQNLTVLTQERTVYDLIAGKGGPGPVTPTTGPYTIGPGGEFDTGSQPRPTTIRAANLLLNTTTPYPVEIPLAILTEQMYQANQVKGITNAQPQSLYYEPTVPLGQIQLWNIPNTAENDLVLYTDLLTAAFGLPSVAYVCPPGYAKAFRLNLAAILMDAFGIPDEQAPRCRADAAQALMDLKMANAQMADLALDPAFVNDTHGTYIIQTDTGA